MRQSNLNQSGTGSEGIPVVRPPRPTRSPGKWLVVSIVILSIGLASALLIQNRAKQTTKAQPAVTVQITHSGFEPETVSVKQGQSVTWINSDTASHQIAADPYPTHASLPALFSGESLAQNETYSFTFDKPGTYTYHDPLHPASLKATVIVE